MKRFIALVSLCAVLCVGVMVAPARGGEIFTPPVAPPCNPQHEECPDSGGGSSSAAVAVEEIVTEAGVAVVVSLLP